MVVLGIDPGLSGGVAVVRSIPGQRVSLIEAIDIPTIGEDAKRRVDALKVMEFIRAHSPDAAVIERAQAMPRTDPVTKEKTDGGASSGFIYGRAVGYLECCCVGMLLKPKFIEASAWKAAHGLKRNGQSASAVKEMSRQRALQLFRMAPYFPLKKHHNRAEAALIAWYGLMLLRGTRDDPSRASIDQGVTA